jgi:hypothetical protein
MSFKFKPTYHVSKYCTKVKTFHLSFLGELSFRIVAAYQKIIVITVFTLNFLTYQPGGLVPMEFLQVPP